DDAAGGVQYAAARLGHFGVKLYRSSDRAQTWEECAAPCYPPQPESDGGEPDPHKWSLDQVWVLESGGPAAPDVIWAGTNPGGLFRSRDRGTTWELVRPLWEHPDRRRWMGGGYDVPGIHSVCVDPRDPDRIAVGVSTGGVWRTRDGGRSWAAAGEGMRAEYMPPELQFDPVAQDPHRLVQCPSSPEWLWVQHHNGIFVSSDGGDRWREIDGVRPSAFGFAVAVHPADPRTAWFVPATKDERRVPVDGRVVVTRTRDGGESFEVLTRGLPQAHAYDLVYRHALDVSAGGDRLAFGSTTGGLWASEDGGDSWHTLSLNLPPVYAVRFAS
ncbi:MAG TPA: exo-alpha-sialidase, partial [Planctomycetaceae bacterium]